MLNNDFNLNRQAVDLHSHSTASDGLLSPSQLAFSAAKAGLAAIALTDHDTVAGVPEFLTAARQAGILPVSGIEISLEHESTFHLLGLNTAGIDGIPAALSDLQDYRRRRNSAMLEKLVSLGYHISENRLMEIATGGQVGRPHFAMALVENGYFSSTEEVFKKILRKGGVGYIDKKRLQAHEGIQMIRQAGWAPVLAHPVSLNLRMEEYPAFIEELVPYGLVGIEAYHPQHDKQWTEYFCRLAARYDLVITAGSDFHGEHKPGSPLDWTIKNSFLGPDTLTCLTGKLN